MKSSSNTPALRRFTAVLAVIAALMVAALTPALVVSLLLTQDTVNQTEPTEQAANIDVTDIDENGTVMYTVSPPEGFRSESDTDFPIPADVLKDPDFIRITVSDDDNSHNFFESETRDDCSFTLHLRDDDRYDAKTGTYTGYLRVTDEETSKLERSDIESQENCGLYIIYATSSTPINP